MKSGRGLTGTTVDVVTVHVPVGVVSAVTTMSTLKRLLGHEAIDLVQLAMTLLPDATAKRGGVAAQHRACGRAGWQVWQHRTGRYARHSTAQHGLNTREAHNILSRLVINITRRESQVLCKALHQSSRRHQFKALQCKHTQSRVCGQPNGNTMQQSDTGHGAACDAVDIAWYRYTHTINKASTGRRGLQTV